MQARPVVGDLGPRQKQFVDGPLGPQMQTYICVGCSKKFPDVGLYFYGRSSTRCIWCTKFPIKK